MISLIKYALWKRGVSGGELELLRQVSTHIVAATRELVNADENGRWNYDRRSLNTYGISATHETNGKIYEVRIQAMKTHLEEARIAKEDCLAAGIPQNIIDYHVGSFKKSCDLAKVLWGEHVAAQFAG